MLAGVLVGLAALAVPVAWASHTFDDVPTTNPHHVDISAIAGAGITTGCNPPTNNLYCPTQNVTRQQMASFIRRGLGRTDAAGTTGPITLTTAFQDIAVVSLTTGGATGGTGAVIATGDFSAQAAVGALSNTARIEYRLVQDGGAVSNAGTTTLYPSSFANAATSVSKTWQFLVDTGVSETFRLQARNVVVAAADATDVTAVARHLQVLYVPFFELLLIPLGQGEPSPIDPNPTG